MTQVRVAVPARVHLAGNPSDGYGGAVLSVTVPSMTATVTASGAGKFSVRGPEETWPTMAVLAAETERLGYDGGDRLVRAALLTLDRALDPSVPRQPAVFEWSSDIPRSVGLGGSSAIVLATMRAALALWGADEVLDDHRLAALALETETKALGIAAGIADRTAQAIGGVVLTDCRNGATATSIPVPQEIPLTLAWRAAAAAPSGDYHAGLRAAFEAGDPAVSEGVAALASLADRAATAVTAGDLDALGSALDASLEMRRSLGRVPPEALAGVDELRDRGAAVNFAGSGGAVVVLGPCAPSPVWQTTETIIEVNPPLT